MELTQVTTALALLAHTLLRIMMAEVSLGESASSLIEGIFIMDAVGMVMPGGVQRLNSRSFGIGHLVQLMRFIN
jgi:hypothetical protein